MSNFAGNLDQHRQALSELAQNRPDLQQTIQAHSALMNALYTHHPDPVMVIQEAGQIASVNNAFNNIFGYPPHILIGQSVAQLGAREQDQHLLLAHDEPNQELPLTLKKYDGTTVSCVLNIIPLLELDPASYILIIRKISTHLGSLDLLENLGIDLIGISDLNGNFKSLTPTWELILGYKAEELIDSNVRAFLHDADRDAAIEQFLQLQRGIPAHDFLARFRCKDGSYKWLLWNAFPILEENIFYFNIRDVTAQQETQHQVDLQRQHLQTIHNILVETSGGFSVQIQKLLAAGMAYLGLKQGIIMQREGEFLRVIYIGEDGYHYRLNEKIEIKQSICQFTLESFEIMAIHDTRQAIVNETPLVQYGECSYIATPIWLKRDSLGTLAFFSVDEDMRTDPFTASDIDFMRMLAHLLNTLLPQRVAQVEANRIYELTHDLIAIINTDGYFQRLSSAWGMLLGYEPQDLYAQRFPDLLHPTDKAAFGFDKRNWNSGERLTNSFEMRIRCVDGSYKWIAWSAAVSSDNLIYFAGHDISDRKRIMAELEAREQKLRSIITSFNDLVVVIDKDGYFLEVHSPNPENLHIPIEESLHHTAFEVMPEHLHDMIRHAIQEVLTTGKLYMLDYWLDSGNGERRWYNAHYAPLRDDTEAIIAITVSIRDITDRKNLEIALMNANAEMELRVQRRTYALEQLNKELLDFTHIISHDLRNPLINIRGYLGELEYTLKSFQTDSAEFALAPEISADIDESIAFIKSSSIEMNEKINAILKLSQLGRRDLNIEAVDLNTVVAEELRNLSHKMRSVEIKIERLPTIQADLLAMKIIWGNVLGNALKYLDPRRQGKIEIKVQTDSNGVVFAIKDNGRGIPEHQTHRVFQLFRRVNSYGDTEGEGIGLAYVQTMVRRHHGRIWFESEFGHGTTFFISLPRDLLSEDGHAKS